MSHNDITGDKLVSKPSTKYADNWERIFGAKKDPDEQPKSERCVIHDNEKVEND